MARKFGRIICKRMIFESGRSAIYGPVVCVCSAPCGIVKSNCLLGQWFVAGAVCGTWAMSRPCLILWPIMARASLRSQYLATPARLRCFWWQWKTFVQEPRLRRCLNGTRSLNCLEDVLLNMNEHDMWVYPVYECRFVVLLMFLCILGAPCSGVACGI